MSFDVYEPARYPVVVWPDSVDGGRHLDFVGELIKGVCTISSGLDLVKRCYRQVLQWKEKGHRSAPADDHFDLGSEGWYRQKQVVWSRLFPVAYIDALCELWSRSSIVAKKEFRVIHVKKSRCFLRHSRPLCLFC
jgi:hypothetical protein